MDKHVRYSDDFHLVNQILSEWNPISVPEDIADSEYTTYIPNILRFRSDYDGLVKEMKRIVNDEIGISFDNFDDDFKQGILLLAKRIIDSLRENEIISARELSIAIDHDNSNSRIK
jgi:hypothetical protein